MTQNRKQPIDLGNRGAQSVFTGSDDDVFEVKAV